MSSSLRPAGHEADMVGGAVRRADTEEGDVPGVPLAPPGDGVHRRDRRVTTAPPGILRRVTTGSSAQDQSPQSRKNTSATDPDSPRSRGSGSCEEEYGKKR